MGTMSWSDDTRCLYCDGKLPLFRKLAQGQFCSKPHQEAYWKEQDQLAVQMLHRTHDALQAYKIAEPIESILGPMPVAKAPPSGPQLGIDFIPEMQGLQRQQGLDNPIAPRSPVIAAADPVEYELHPPTATPNQETESECEFETLAGLIALDKAAAIAPGAMPVPLSMTALDAQLIVSPPGWSPNTMSGLAFGGLLDMQGLRPVGAPSLASVADAVEFEIPAVRDLALTLAPRGDVLERMEQEAFPQMESLLPLAPLSAQDSQALRGTVEFREFSQASVMRPQPMDVAERPLSLVAAAGMFALSGSISSRNWHAPMSLNGVAFLEPRTPSVAMELVRLQPAPAADPLTDLLSQVGCAPLRSLPFFEACGNEESPASRPVSYQAFVSPSAVLLPDSVKRPIALALLEIRTHATQPYPLKLGEKMKARADRRLRPGFVALPLQGEPLLPQSNLQPQKLKFAMDGAPAVDGAILDQEPPVRRMAAGVANFWNHAPRDLKMLLFAVPLALGLAFHPSLPKVSLQAAQTDPTAVSGQFQQVLHTQMANLRKGMAERAAVGLDENFRQGLDNWMSHSGSTAEWSFDQAGFVQPGRVALYQPSLGLTDYEFQFLGAIDKGALSWVARAVDFQNYYVVKLVRLKEGPVPEMGVTRYAVINGKPVDRVDTPVAFAARTDSLYRVSMVMEGDHYSLVIQGQNVDSWDEPRLKRGGIGFFTNRGEESRIGWVQITHQYDMLGRLFAYLAP